MCIHVQEVNSSKSIMLTGHKTVVEIHDKRTHSHTYTKYYDALLATLTFLYKNTKNTANRLKATAKCIHDLQNKKKTKVILRNNKL